MNAFSTKLASPAGALPDPSKHVKFSYGMVLGADDFSQEFAYLSARDQALARELIGYGSVSGLSVSIEDGGSRGPRAVVAPGLAVTPRGELVRVPLAQCGYLDAWLGAADQVKHVQQRLGNAMSGRIDLYIALCYRGCETDKVPIPGEPCRTEGTMTEPSRVMDDFRLELRFDPPEQPDEAAIRDFVAWLAGIPIVDGPSSVSLKDFLEAIRFAAFLIGSPPPSPPDFMYGVPPATVTIGRDDRCRYFRAAFRLWVTELRPKWNATWWGMQSRCADAAPFRPPDPEACLLLARLDVPLVRGSLVGPVTWRVESAANVVVDEERRPFLVPVRMLQEWLWCGCACGTAAGAAPGAAGSVQGELAAGGSVVVGAAATGQFQLRAFMPQPPTPALPIGEFKVTFAGYEDPTAPAAAFDYVVVVTPKSRAGVTSPRLEFLAFDPDGIRLRLKNNTQPAAAANFPLMIEVKRYAK